MERLSLRAPAKVNLRLEVLGKRPDGYHEIKTWMYPISLADELTVARDASAGISLVCTHPGLPLTDENLAYRAADSFLKEHGLVGGVRIELTKRIPVAAGLGGGSSDAAAVLKAMNILWQTQMSPEALHEMGAAIGSDVPFFIVGKGAVMEGRGEQVFSVLPPLAAWLVLINPGVPLSTQQVYQQGKWGLTKQGGGTKIPKPPQDLKKMGDFLRNDLERSATELLPVIGEIKEKLRASGAHGVLMAGSGPTVFGLCATEAAAQQVAQDAARAKGWLSFVAHTLTDA
jgi:4-diphosphocytidyl-2-C-methyl-D-erythritol kinase